MSFKNNPTFFKEIPLQLKIQGNFNLVYFATGFSKPVDPLSGMTVNLTKVIQWQNDFKLFLADQNFSSWLSFFKQATEFFQKKAVIERAELKALQVRFFEGQILRQDSSGLFLIQSGAVVKNNKVFIGQSKKLFQADEDLKSSLGEPTEIFDPETGITNVF